MLDQLFYFWRAYEACQWSPSKLQIETQAWLSQHCVDADDFAFGIGSALANYAFNRA